MPAAGRCNPDAIYEYNTLLLPLQFKKTHLLLHQSILICEVIKVLNTCRIECIRVLIVVDNKKIQVVLPVHICYAKKINQLTNIL